MVIGWNIFVKMYNLKPAFKQETKNCILYLFKRDLYAFKKSVSSIKIIDIFQM